MNSFWLTVVKALALAVLGSSQNPPLPPPPPPQPPAQ